MHPWQNENISGQKFEKHLCADNHWVSGVDGRRQPNQGCGELSTSRNEKGRFMVLAIPEDCDDRLIVCADEEGCQRPSKPLGTHTTKKGRTCKVPWDCFALRSQRADIGLMSTSCGEAHGQKCDQKVGESHVRGRMFWKT